MVQRWIEQPQHRGQRERQQIMNYTFSSTLALITYYADAHLNLWSHLPLLRFYHNFLVVMV